MMENARSIFTLAETVPFKPHIFNPTSGGNSANRIFFSRLGVHRVYQFSINSKVSRWLSRGTRESLAKDFRGRVIQSLSRRAVS